jgi:hypothetical protein
LLTGEDKEIGKRVGKEVIAQLAAETAKVAEIMREGIKIPKFKIARTTSIWKKEISMAKDWAIMK